jgi:hypothetical protein
VEKIESILLGFRLLCARGQNSHQKVPDETYIALLCQEKTNLTVQKTCYYHNKLKGKKYLIIENDENPESPKKRYRIESITEGSGQTVEDIYGTIINGPHLVINLKLREKTE